MQATLTRPGTQTQTRTPQLQWDDYVSRYLPLLLIALPLGFNVLLISAVTPPDISDVLGKTVQTVQSDSPDRATKI